MAHFSDEGRHCSEDYCGQKDFLPFTCSRCEKVFCITHYPPASHSCSNIDAFDRRALICPICLQVVPYQNQASDAAWEEHVTTPGNCRPELYEKRKAEQQATHNICPVPSCKQKLTAVSRYECRKCKVTVCMKHRFPEDHSCRNFRVNSSTKPLSRWWSQATTSEKNKLKSFNTASNELKETAHRRQGGRRTAPPKQEVGDSNLPQAPSQSHSKTQKPSKGCVIQ